MYIHILYNLGEPIILICQRLNGRDYVYLCEEIRGWTPTAPHSPQIPVRPLFFGASIFPSLLFPFLSFCLSSHPPFLQFIFQFAPRSSQVCARRKFAEAAGAPLEATWRRDRRGTIRPSPSLLSLPLVLPHVLFLPSFFSLSVLLSFPLSPVALCLQPARLHRSSG